METASQQSELGVEDPVPTGLIKTAAESPQEARDKSPCERVVDLVTEELKEATSAIDHRAKRFASFIVPGLVEGHFMLDSDQPNPVHKRIHGILGKLHEQKKLPKEIATKLFGPASEA